MLTLGVHVSISGKIYKAVERAAGFGCNTFQIFSRNPRQFRKTCLDEEDGKEFRQKVKEYNINPVVIHIPYTLNLASGKRELYKISIKDFILDLRDADQLGADFLVTHMGSYKGATESGGLLRVANALNKILKETKDIKTMVLLENTSGSGHWLGYKFSQLKFIMDRLNIPERVGICLDTAHAWAAGYQIDNAVGVNSLVKEIESEVGISRIKLIHLNDTQVELGSLLDRHFAIGKGKIGKKGFSCILSHKGLKDIPLILETPKKDQGDGDIENLKMVRRLYKEIDSGK